MGTVSARTVIIVLAGQAGSIVEQTAGTPSRARTLSLSPTTVLLLLILALTLALRLYGVNWDSGTAIHPDERAIAGWVNGLQFPHSPFDLFNRNSFWNPSMHPDGSHDPGGFNYGSLPLYLIFIGRTIVDWLAGFLPWLSGWRQNGSYGNNILTGRVLSALADTVTVFLVYLIGARLAGRVTGLYAAALAAVAVLSIQLSHFATVDILLTTFATGALLASIDLFTEGRPRDYALVGLWVAAAIATKASGVAFIGVVLVAHLWRRGRVRDLLGWGTIVDLWPAVAVAIPALFLFQPFMFSDWTDFWTGVSTQQALASGSTIAFYTIKWHGTMPILYPLQQLTLYSLGIPLALLAYAGLIYEGIRVLTPKRNAGALVACFVVLYFVFVGLQYMKYLRYMEPIVPALCVLAALLVSALARARVPLLGRFVQRVGLVIGALVLVLTACYGLAYEHIYAQPLTRIQATCWLFTHVPSGTPIAQDTFDEGMPVGNCTPPLKVSPAYPPGVSMPAYGSPDTLATAQTIATVLSQAQFYVISSRRGMDTMAADPAMFPYYHRFYQLLLGSKTGAQDPLGYTLIKTFIEHPQLGPWTDTEQGANQNFDEYDHPPVSIFKNTGHHSADAIVGVLDNQGLLAVPITMATPPKSLLLTPKQIATNQHAPSYGQMFPATSLPMRLPIPVWLLMIEALGLLALPISMRLFGRLRDCGFVIAKTVGILLLSWFAWILPSLGLAEYSRGEIALGLIPLGAISLLWGVQPRDMPAILRARLRPILLTEGAFLLGFAVFV
ncbi:MAG TPA: glycosyltransferase family 39 protein, partial [Chloroflexota bacterium]|nr:glycosyltransferase family 39 protein [Chloroflexota bacterium]